MSPLCSNIVNISGTVFSVSPSPALTPIKLFANSKLANSSTRAIAEVVFASVVLLIIPFSPVKTDMLTPAKINNTMIVTTRAIRVIPSFLLLNVSIFVPSFHYNFYMLLLKRKLMR